MSCLISELERCWYLSPPWGKQLPNVEVQLWERVYITASGTFGYCCGVVWQDDQAIRNSQFAVRNFKLIHSGIQSLKFIYEKSKTCSINIQIPDFSLEVLIANCELRIANCFGDRVLLRFTSHATKQRLVLGVVLVNGSWFYVVEMVSPALSEALGSPIRFPLVSELDLIKINT